MNKLFLTGLLPAMLLSQQALAQTLPNDKDLLFYQSCDNTLEANVHQGKGQPNFVAEVTQIADGVKGKAFHCGDSQLLTYWAPGNMYSQRGTFSMYWRSAQELTDIEFPIWRVAYADHSSWDMVWMRIDYNGSGFDAFVTDNGLSRVRVSYKTKEGLDPQKWYHIVFTWDENVGVALWVDGKKVAEKLQPAVLDAGLDQMGAHSRIIAPYQVQTAYNCVRGGDIDEIRVYGTSLFDNANAQQRVQAWQHRYGFDSKQQAPQVKDGATTAIRKVQIQKAYDQKRWYWKGCDGMKETTWPGVYNRSRLAGRFDYQQLPDWDCYSTSGKQVRFIMPDEPWNHVEMTGSAWGSLAVSADTAGTNAKEVAKLAQTEHHSIVRLGEAVNGQTMVFTNVMQEEPIQEIDAYYVTEADAPKGICRLSYVATGFDSFNNPRLLSMEQWIDGRHPEGERQKLLALPVNKNSGKVTIAAAKKIEKSENSNNLPLFHIIIPNDTRDLTDNVAPSLNGAKVATSNTGLATVTKATNYSWRYMQGGLDGIELSLPALAESTAPIQLNIQVKDPLWPMRNMMDYTLSVNPAEAHKLWLDLRDRILPIDKPLYLTIAASDTNLGIEKLGELGIQLVFKPYDEAKKEHVEDRLTQIIDSYGQLVEEGTSVRKLNKYVQLEGDMEDLLRVDKDNELGRKYWYQYNNEQVAPAFKAPKIPEGVPAWAHLQLEVLREYRELIEWYIDNRQIENGEFGGGLSDDTDLGNLFPGLILNGAIPDKATESLHRMLEAIYDQGLLTKGVSTIMTDGLHTYEEGGNTIVQCNIVEPGNPLQVERMMETARTTRDWLLGHNEKGHLHFRSDYFSATRIADKGTWTWSSPREFYHLAPAILLGEFYGNEDARKYILEFVDDMLEHSTRNKKGVIQLPVEVNFLTDEVRRWGTNYCVSIFWYCYLWTGDNKYLEPLKGTSTDKLYTTPLQTKQVEKSNLQLLHNISDRRFMMREGAVWIDRVYFNCDDIQRQRMGGLAMNRSSNFVPGNVVTWRFENDADAEKVAILIPVANNKGFEATFFNTTGAPVKVNMTGMQVLGGTWKMNDEAVQWGRNRTLTLTIPAGKEYKVKMELMSDGIDFNSYTDLGIGKEDIAVAKNKKSVTVTLHNLSSKEAPATRVVLKDAYGNVIAETASQPLAAPQDMIPSTQKVTINVPKGASLSGCTVVIDPDNTINEIYKQNNCVAL